MLRWRKLRLLILKRDNWRCIECNSQVKGRNAHVHHKIPRALGGADTEQNLITLCAGCHSQKHLNLHASLGRRWLETTSVRLAKWFAKGTLDNLDGAKLGLAMRYLKIKRLKSVQLQPILAAIAGKSILFISPTGSGKSLCFQIPALVQIDHSVVVSPLKALMSDQVKGLLDKDVPATFINSDISIDERKARLALIEQKAIKLVYLAPERLVKNERRKKELEIILGTTPAYLIVDEAHCIDKWGDAFRPSYLQIGEARRAMRNPPVLAFTATAGIQTRKRILSNLFAEDAEVFVEGVDRPNIALIRFKASQDQKRSDLINELFTAMRKRIDGKVLIFVPTIKVGEKVQNLLSEVNIAAPFFHGKLSAPDRDFILGRFDNRIEPTANILICTNAFGMGMDIPNVRIVFHWQHPSSVEDYLQEFGRAGRDGKQALAVLFRSNEDLRLPQYMLKKNLENLRLDQLEKNRIYQNKNTAIDLMNSFTNDKLNCFTELIKNELDCENQTTSGLARWILNLVFSDRAKKQKRRFCCDACWKKQTERPLSNFAKQVIENMAT